MFSVPERFRVRRGALGSNGSDGNNGIFIVKSRNLQKPLIVHASDGDGWEHVSVSLGSRPPTWGEMSYIKSLFWGSDDLVVQFHPPASRYANNHPYCLHLWRKCGTNEFCAQPDPALVGVVANG